MGERSARSLILSLLVWVGLTAVQTGRSVPTALAAAPTMSAPGTTASAVTREQEEFFETHIRPVLVEKCFECHGPERQKAGLRLDSREAILKGTSSAVVVTPGQPEQSSLIAAIRYTGDVQMPPSGKLPDAAIEAITRWVAMGLPWPASDAPQGAASQPASESEIARARREHWSFRPVQDPPVPAVRNSDWCSNEIDRFILAKLEEKKMSPSPRADRRTLIRRATFDLHGLPPTPQEIDAFIKDPAPDREAFAALVDRLLASPRYGERWGRHWLDVARYADTKGYVFQEERRFPYAWTYRDFVIRAFNEDLPYDRFVLYQLAADLLPLGEDPSPLAAMGFLTLGRRFINNIHDIIDDRIDVVTRGLQGLTVSCARCHDHKYDPIPTADYYALYGVFASSVEPVEKPLIGRPEDNEAYRAYQKELAARREKLEAFRRNEHAALLAKLRAQTPAYLMRTLNPEARTDGEMLLGDQDLRPEVVDRWKKFIAGWKGKHHPVFAPWHALARLKPETFAAQAPPLLAELAMRAHPGAKERMNWPIVRRLLAAMPTSMAEVARIYGETLVEIDRRWREAHAASIQPAGGGQPIEKLADAEEEELRQILHAEGSPTALTQQESPRLFDRAAREKYRDLRREIEEFQVSAKGAPPAAMSLEDGKIVEPRIFVRGNPNNPGKPVPRRFLTVLAAGEPEPFKHGSGRLELARAIASPDNPLTARVMVNRVWLHHFGEGLVRTPSDFGTRGEPPTHPELLDWLASRFVEGGWSIKRLHRLIMNSSTYQQCSDVREEHQRLDPDNRLLARMNRRRLDFESMRDALLAVADRLDLTMGGPSVEITEPPFSTRRSVYGFIDRQNLPPVMRMFDFANPDTTNAQRHQTTVPQQALFLMNSPFVIEQARYLSWRPEVTQTHTNAESIEQLYRLVFGRLPSAREMDIGRSFVERPDADEDGPPPEPVVWRYGYGWYEPSIARVASFTAFDRYEDGSYGGRRPPADPELGWVHLTRDGGHTGDARHQAIRRWVAPVSGRIRIEGTLHHPPREQRCGDGVQAWIVSSRRGELAHYVVQFSELPTRVETQVEEGDTIDFVVDARESVSCDSFQWAPVVQLIGESTPQLASGTDGQTAETRTDIAGNAAPGRTLWDARTDFGPPPGPPPRPLNAWEQYAQVLLLTNEFVFVD